MLRILTAALAMTLTASPALADPLDDLRWQSRPVVIFAADANDPRVEQQTALLTAQSAALAERDMTIITVAGDRVTRDGAPFPAAPTGLRSRLRVEGGTFTVLLLGKDGGIKRRETTVTFPEALFRQIDAMPMRQQEMRLSD